MGQPVPEVPSPQGKQLSEWWKRLVALIIDGLIVGVPSNIIGGIVFASLFTVSVPTYNPATGRFEGGAGFFGRMLASYGAFFIAYLAISGAYYIYLHASRGQTVGKMAMKIKVIDEQTGELIDYGRAAVRWAIPQALSLFTCGIAGILNGLWPLWDPKRQTWHDKVARTVVVDAE